MRRPLQLVVALWATMSSAGLLPSHPKRQAASNVAPSAFRRRGYTAVTTLNRWAYIDGGEFSYYSDGEIVYQYSSSLIGIDLSGSWVNQSVALISIEKPNVPDLVSGGIWLDEKRNQFYMGFAGRASEFGNGISQPTGIWAFKPDNAGSGKWTNLNQTVQGYAGSVRPFSPLVASGGGTGYMLGGFMVNSSVAGYDAAQDIPISGLVSYNYTSSKFNNMTVTGISMGGVDQMGGMVFVPNFGSQGILVAVGGDQVGHLTKDSDYLLNIDTVSIFDVDSGLWYEQKTTGDIPENRKEFCIAGLASNNETYEIFVYAGWNGNLGSRALPFDEAFVLSLPAFQWFKAQYPAANPRHGVSCTHVGGPQILTVGGVDTTQNGENLYDGVFDTADPFAQGLNIFDMNDLAFATQYNAKPAQYTGAPIVREYYAQNQRTPGFTNSLSTVFATSSFPSSSAATSSAGPGSGSSSGSGSGSQRKHKSNTGAIVGGVIGGVIGLILLSALVFFGLSRARRHRNNNDGAGLYPSEAGGAPRYEMSGTQGLMHEIGDGGVKHRAGGDVYAKVAPTVNQEPQELPGSTVPPAPAAHTADAEGPTTR